MNDWFTGAYSAVVAALLAAIGFLIREVFTNKTKVQVLEAQLENIEQDVAEIKTDLKSLLYKTHPLG